MVRFPVVLALAPVELLAARAAFQQLVAVLDRLEAEAKADPEELKRLRSMRSTAKRLLGQLPELAG